MNYYQCHPSLIDISAHYSSVVCVVMWSIGVSTRPGQASRTVTWKSMLGGVGPGVRPGLITLMQTFSLAVITVVRTYL